MLKVGDKVKVVWQDCSLFGKEGVIKEIEKSGLLLVGGFDGENYYGRFYEEDLMVINDEDNTTEREMTTTEFLDALEHHKKVKGTLNLDARDWMIMGYLIADVEKFSNNTSVSRDDVISGLLSFYNNAKLIDYHKQFKNDIAIYIGNRVTTKR